MCVRVVCMLRVGVAVRTRACVRVRACVRARACACVCVCCACALAARVRITCVRMYVRCVRCVRVCCLCRVRRAKVEHTNSFIQQPWDIFGTKWRGSYMFGGALVVLIVNSLAWEMRHVRPVFKPVGPWRHDPALFP